jgi:GT2 family glycosyltransferase
VIAMVVLTYNRLHLLRKCVDNVLLRTSDDTTTIIIWNNASTDGTSEYLDALDHPRIRVVNHDENIGQSGYARAFRETTEPFMLELDDDMIDAPQDWDRAMLEAYQALPKVGFLQARLADDGFSPGSDLFYRENRHLYELKEVPGTDFKIWQGGPVGGGCTITDRELHDRVGGFIEHKKLTFFYEDQEYVQAIRRLGYETAVLDDIEVFHAGGPHYAELVPEKLEFWAHRDRIASRKDTVKRILLAIPFVRPLNAKRGWFQPPAPRKVDRRTS